MNNDSSASIVSKVWNYAHVLKNAGVGYGPAWRGIEQITYLLFLKLAPPSSRSAGLRRAGSEMTLTGFDSSYHPSRTSIA